MPGLLSRILDIRPPTFEMPTLRICPKLMCPLWKYQQPRPRNLHCFPFWLVNFIGTLGFSIVLPFLIVLVLKFGGNELIYGLMGATYSFFQLIGAPMLGRWSDKYGRKKILLLSQIGTFIAWVIFAVALLIPARELLSVESGLAGVFVLTAPLLLLFIARTLDGITGGNVSIANAYLADISTEANRKQNFGKMGASANLGFIIGPALAGVLGATAMGEILPVLMAMGISLLAIFVIVFVMHESNPCIITSRLSGTKINNIMGQEHKECYEVTGANKLTFRGAFALDNIGFILVLYFLIFLAFNFFYVAFPIYAVQGLEWTLLELGTFFSAMGMALVLVQGPVLSRLSRRYTDIQLVITGGALLALSFAVFTQASTLMMYGGLLFMALGNGIMWPSFLSILSKAAGSRYQGAIQGYASSMGSAASIIGLISGGVIYGHMGNMTFVIPAIVMLVTFFATFRLRQIQMDRT